MLFLLKNFNFQLEMIPETCKELNVINEMITILTTLKGKI